MSSNVTWILLEPKTLDDVEPLNKMWFWWYNEGLKFCMD